MARAYVRLVAALVVVGFACVAFAASATAPETLAFSSSKGFSLRYPATWAVASKDLTSEIKSRMQSYADKFGKYDLDRLAVVVLNPADADAASNLNVVVSYTNGERFEINEDAKPKVLEIVKQTAQAFGWSTANERVSIETFGANRARVARYLANIQGQELACMQVFMFGQWDRYTVTCTSAPDNLARDEPVFAAMLNSIVIDVDPSTVPTWLFVATIICAFGVCIALAWLLVVIDQRTRKRRHLDGDAMCGPIGKFFGGAIRLVAILLWAAGLLPIMFGLAILSQQVPRQPIHHVYDLFNMTYSGLFNLCLGCVMWELPFLLKPVADRLDGGKKS